MEIVGSDTTCMANVWAILSGSHPSHASASVEAFVTLLVRINLSQNRGRANAHF